ncbi:MAG: hypothetical protein GY714_09180 [Desulfobacterales bacterium]|nr:hypothetical protein [Desulfobacterales bacterium]
MPVFCKNITKEERAAFERFESISGFEIMFQKEIDSGEKTPQEAFSENMDWFEGVYADVTNINFPERPECENDVNNPCCNNRDVKWVQRRNKEAEKLYMCAECRKDNIGTFKIIADES